jgi:hypothetical protein
MNGPFLTDIDSRAAVKGSRDPLGIQSIWTRFGRHVVGNLTTVSTSLRDFTTLLLGYYFVERIGETGASGADLSTFLKWEQLAGYARGQVNRDWVFRGTERVRKNLNESPRVTLSADRSHQILSDQKIYGLWGLYTGPARTSGLVEGDPTRLTPAAYAFVEAQYLPILAKEGIRDGKAILALLGQASAKVDTKGKEVAAIARMLRRHVLAKERPFYRDGLLFGGPADDTGGRQRQLAELLATTFDEKDFAFEPTVLRHLVKMARRGNADGALALRLERIRVCESVMAPASALFGFLLGRDGKTVDSIVKTLREQWGMGLRTIDLEAFRMLKPELQDIAGNPEPAKRWMALAEGLATGDYAETIRCAIDQNRHMMKTRGGGAPWISIDQGRLGVRFRDETGRLPAATDLPGLWRFPYFLHSLRVMAIALKEA